jgi:hypothetical protein
MTPESQFHCGLRIADCGLRRAVALCTSVLVRRVSCERDAAIGVRTRTAVGPARVLSDIPWQAPVPVVAFLLLKDTAAIRRTMLTALPHLIQ